MCFAGVAQGTLAGHRNDHGTKHAEEDEVMEAGEQRGRRRGRIATVMLGIAGAVLALVTAAPADAESQGSTVKITINLAALPLDNLCNGDVVNLSGDMTITTTTTPARNGGYTVRSSAVAKNLRGQRIAPPPMIGYRGSDGENTYSYYAPPPYPSTHRVVHWTTLIPEGNAPRMYLVLVIRETIAADGTVIPVFERAYLVCKQPSCSAKKV
jgi:hypothetical protein